jgi:hypothetical protein
MYLIYREFPQKILIFYSRENIYLKVPKCEIFDRSDFHDFSTIKPFKTWRVPSVQRYPNENFYYIWPQLTFNRSSPVEGAGCLPVLLEKMEVGE